MQICMACRLCQNLARNERREHPTGGHVALKYLRQVKDKNVPGLGHGAGAGEVTGHISTCSDRYKILIEVARCDDASVAIVSLRVERDGTEPKPRHLP